MSKRELYIRALSDALKTESMKICHEAIIRESEIRDLIELLSEKKVAEKKVTNCKDCKFYKRHKNFFSKIRRK